MKTEWLPVQEEAKDASLSPCQAGCGTTSGPLRSGPLCYRTRERTAVWAESAPASQACAGVVATAPAPSQASRRQSRTMSEATEPAEN